jgi:hypothetical protein
MVEYILNYIRERENGFGWNTGTVSAAEGCFGSAPDSSVMKITGGILYPSRRFIL